MILTFDPLTNRSESIVFRFLLTYPTRSKLIQSPKSGNKLFKMNRILTVPAQLTLSVLNRWFKTNLKRF